MMKNNKIIYTVIFLMLCLIVLNGCFSDWQGDGTGTITISLGGNAVRSIWANEHNEILKDLVYDIELIREIDGEKKEFFAMKDDLRVALTEGNWIITLTAYLLDVGVVHPYAIGIKTVNVIAGMESRVNVIMEPAFCKECKDYPCTCQAVECPCKDGGNCICGDDCECDCECCNTDCECGECEECNPECDHYFPDEWDTITYPTCTETGSEENICTKCNEHHTDSPRTIEKLQHNFPADWTTVKPATCAEAGSEERKCPDCGTHAAGSPRTIGQLQHNFPANWTTVKPATCAESGNEKRKCPDCGTHAAGSPRTIGQLQHNFPANWTTVKPATCAESGSEERKCPDCGTHTTDSPRTIGQLQHNFPANWTTVKPATCAESGSEERKCPDCGTHAAGSPRAINQLQHLFSNYISNNNARCGEDGTETGICSRSDCTVPDTRIITGSALTHIYPAWQTPTCTIAGNQTRTCTRANCGNVETRVTGFQPLGHNFNENWTGTPASCLTAGNETRTCTRNCSEPNNSEQRNVPPLGHDHFESLICKRGSCGFQYTLGAIGPAGGRIFHVATAGFIVQGYGNPGQDGYFATYRAHYLEAAPANAVGGTGAQTTMRWSTRSATPYPDVTGTLTNIGSGRNNTALIIAAEKAAYPDDTYIYAALACKNYTSTGFESFNDWFLPSRDELNQLHNRRTDFGLSSGWFWSSSQNLINTAWYKDFADGFQNGASFKDFSNNVRPVRAF